MPTGVRVFGSAAAGQYRALASLRRPAITSGSAGSNRSNSSISRVRTLVRSSPAVRLTKRDQPVERRCDVLLQDLDVGGGERRARCRRARRRRPRPRPGAARWPAAGTRSDAPRPWPRHGWGWRPGSPDTPRSAASKSPASRCARACATSGSTCSGSSPSAPPPSLPAVAFSSESTHRRNCSGGCTPWKLDSGWPAASATTVGTACTPNICATRGTVSTFTVASDHLPPSAASRLREGVAELRRSPRCAATTAAPRRAPGWTGPAPRLRGWPR